MTFGDDDTARAIMNADHPREQKRLGKIVRNFDERTWSSLCREVAKKGNVAKFSQNPVLKEYLLSTGDSQLAEASAYDKKWGIGQSADNPTALNPDRWTGENLLGRVLMEVRELLRESQAANQLDTNDS